MRRKVAWLCAIAMVCAGSVPAITTDGDWSDWFTYNGAVGNNNWQQGNYTLQNLNIRAQGDEEGPSPGGGGQAYDIEEILYFFEDFNVNDANSGGILHIGLVTGFDSAGEFGAGGPHYAGDMFIDFGNTGGFDVAIGTGTEVTPENDGGARFGNAWLNTGAPNWTLLSVNVPAHQGVSDPYRVDEDAPGAQDISGLASAAWGGMGVHNFLEVALVVDGGIEAILTDPINGGVGLHWTMLCGNDEIDVQDDDPFAPVPEPSTFVLLGMGALGLMLRTRRLAC